MTEQYREVQVHAALTDFFSSTQVTATANQIRQCTMGYRSECWSAEECLRSTPLHFASAALTSSGA